MQPASARPTECDNPHGCPRIGIYRFAPFAAMAVKISQVGSDTADPEYTAAICIG
jgi:hypothetical protein